MHQLLRELESQLPPDCEERVIQAKDRYNQLIRKRITNEIRLNLKGRHVIDRISSEIPIKVVSGFPSPLEDFVEKSDEDIVAELIGIWESDVINLGQSSKSILDLLSRIEQLDVDWKEAAPRYMEALGLTSELSDLLSEKAKLASLAKRVFAIQDDILGIYRPRYDSDGEVELYWGAIGVAAKLLQVDIEDLATVILIHELAHGYTHLGKDIDDESWDTALMFNDVDRAVIEGLAQYYTDVISAYLGDVQSQNIHHAYLRLRRMQRGWYRVHDRWMEEFSPEVMRISVLKFRRDKATSLEDFEKILADEKASLRSSSMGLHPRVQADIDKYGPLRSKQDELLDSLIIQEQSGELEFRPANEAVQALAQAWDLSVKFPFEGALSEWNMSPTREFRKSIDKLDKVEKARILDAIMDIMQAPIMPRGDTIKRLTGDFEGMWRCRIGSARLLYRANIETKCVILVEYAPRGSAYDN